ncbi:unnamed protein product, partial [Gulo gulo]
RGKIFVSFSYCFLRKYTSSLQRSFSPRLQWRCPSRIQFFICQDRILEIRYQIKAPEFLVFYRDTRVTGEFHGGICSYFLPSHCPANYFFWVWNWFLGCRFRLIW